MKRVFGELELRSAWQRLAPILGGDAEEALPRAGGIPAPPTVDLSAVTASMPGRRQGGRRGPRRRGQGEGARGARTGVVR